MTQADPRLAAGYFLPHPAEWSTVREHVTSISRGMLLDLAVRLAVRVPGEIVEFGVATGASTRVIRRSLRRHGRFARHGRKRLFALDSFAGLDESFENAPAGTFAGKVPRIRGVRFVKGRFDETCTEDLRREVGRVALAHLDADLYASTKLALDWLTPLLGGGSMLLFDEFTGGDGAEARAFEEWRARSGTQLVRLAEVDRDPSGFGTVPDRRLLYQVVGKEPLAPRRDERDLRWKISYYLGRLGLDELKSRVDEGL